MGVALAEWAKPSKRQTIKRRRRRCEDRAGKFSVTEAIQATADYHMLRQCGWDACAREMRRLEPPTRSIIGGGWRRNGWYMPGKAELYPGVDAEKWSKQSDSQKLVPPVHAAVWLWWLSLTDGQQDVMMELSAACSKSDDGICRTDPDPFEMLRDMQEAAAIAKTNNGVRLYTMDGEDPRQWGRAISPEE